MKCGPFIIHPNEAENYSRILAEQLYITKPKFPVIKKTVSPAGSSPVTGDRFYSP